MNDILAHVSEKLLFLESDALVSDAAAKNDIYWSQSRVGSRILNLSGLPRA